MRNLFVCLTLLAAVLALTVGTQDVESAAVREWVGRKAIEVEHTHAGLVARFPILNPTGQRVDAKMTVRIVDLNGKEQAAATVDLKLQPNKRKYEVNLVGDIPSDQMPLYVIQYTLQTPSGMERGARSLMAVLAQLETRVVAYRDLLAGSDASVRVVALNHATGKPVKGATVAIALVQGEEVTSLYKGRTNGKGTLDAAFAVPDMDEAKAQLRVKVSHARLGKDEATVPVTVQRRAKLLLNTDKPMYQPGQQIQMRALCLGVGSLKPEAGKDLIFEVMDSKGNKVFKHPTQTSEYGVASAKFQLASEVNQGAYTVRAILGKTQSEKQVTVERYVLPKFKVHVATERDYYLPGETLKGTIQSDYFFGKPVAGGTVEIVASKFEIEFQEFARIEGKLDAEGHWEFEIPLPDFFAGTPLEQGEASVRLEAFVTDTADHREEKVTMTPVAAAQLNIFAVPESGGLVPRLDNRVYVLVSYPDGTPAKGARLAVTGRGVDAASAELITDELGIATVTVKAPAAAPTKLRVRASDKQGHTTSKEFDLANRGGDDALILRTEQVLYSAGDTLRADAYTTKPAGTVYFDLVRNGQTVMTRAADLVAGRASLVMDLDEGTSGSVVLQAYVFTGAADILRDARLLYVNPADSLQLDISLDKDTYQPGQHAQIRFVTRNKAGAGTPSAIGVTIIDESVYALQEIHPGLEKVYFTLEKEIMQPRYEIHGYKLDDIVSGQPGLPVRPGGMAKGQWTDTQQEAARVLLASAPAVPEPPVRLNTFIQRQRQADTAVRERFEKDYQHIQRAVQKYFRARDGKLPRDLLSALLRGKHLRPNELLDPWGNMYEFDFSQAADSGGFFTMRSNGPDEVKDTPDDLTTDHMFKQMRRGRMRLGAEMMVADAMPMPAPMAAKRAEMEMADGDMAFGGIAGVPADEAAGGPQPPRLREYFPETLLFEPSLITDATGTAVLDLTLADSITTWRMSAMASSALGALGSKETPLRVFQDFFVDLDLPVALTQNDRVSIPVVMYNYLTEAQDVRLKFDEEPWFTLDGEAEQTIRLAPEEVKAMYFPIEVKELGRHRLTVWAYGSEMSDAIRREVDVTPDGQEQNITFSDRLSGKTEHTVLIPPNAVEGASKVLVRVYPGMYSQIVDGLDSMLQMPCGCFEQTTASTYPNVLIVQYMKATEQLNPETQMKAEGFINNGYQRLLAYEVQGGGFSWFGEAPANKALTALGVKQFYDMAEVHEVDPAVIDRTRAWLLSRQEADGSWKPDEQYLHADTWSGIQSSGVLVTAYILEAILSTGDTGPGTQKAIDYLRANWQDAKDAYTLALLSNALVA
ncbi:MAG: hypothetical protein GY851_11880, partial [bacterium]|nr:hypothetical protein [bacterium]